VYIDCIIRAWRAQVKPYSFCLKNFGAIVYFSEKMSVLNYELFIISKKYLKTPKSCYFPLFGVSIFIQ